MENRRLLIEFNRGIPKNQKEIEGIKKDFLLNDISCKNIISNGGNPILDLNKSNIQTEVVVGKLLRIVQDEFGFEEVEVDLEHDLIDIDFYEEFDKALNLSFDKYCSNFIKKLNSKGIYTRENLEGFKKMQLKKINILAEDLKQNSNMENKIMKSITLHFNKIYDYTSNFNLEDYQISDKLKFKLNRNQVIWLFLSMLDKRVISGITMSDLFRFLDANVEYFDEKGYKPMVKSRLQGNKFINCHVSPSQSAQVLSKIFNRDFFN